MQVGYFSRFSVNKALEISFTSILNGRCHLVFHYSSQSKFKPIWGDRILGRLSNDGWLEGAELRLLLQCLGEAGTIDLTFRDDLGV